MNSNTKKKVSIFLGLAVLLTALLASSLSQLELQPGMPLPAFNSGSLIISENPRSQAIQLSINGFFLYLLGIVAAAYLVVILYRLAMGTDYKKLVASLIKFILVTTAAFLPLVLIILLLPKFITEVTELPPGPAMTPLVTAPLGPPPASLLWLVGIGLAVMAAFFVLSIFTSRRKPDQTAQLAREVEKARQSLLAGLDLKEVILRCYQQMSLILKQEGGIERQAFMTPSEFERMLSKAGFPQSPVHQLTSLFEVARYGNWTPNPWDDQKAIDNLQAIIVYLREQKALAADE